MLKTRVPNPWSTREPCGRAVGEHTKFHLCMWGTRLCAQNHPLSPCHHCCLSQLPVCGTRKVGGLCLRTSYYNFLAQSSFFLPLSLTHIHLFTGTYFSRSEFQIVSLKKSNNYHSSFLYERSKNIVKLHLSIIIFLATIVHKNKKRLDFFSLHF